MSNLQNQDYLSNNNVQTKSNYLEEQYPSKSYGIPNYNKNSSQNTQYPSKTSSSANCGGAKCTYKCDSSYMNAIKYLDGELKPLEGFGNIGTGYAPF